MAGGRGTRFGGPGKPLALLHGRPLVEWVAEALGGAHSISRVRIAGSSHLPQVARWAQWARRGFEARHRKPLEYRGTPGLGYVEDLPPALRGLRGPVVVAAADIPRLTPRQVDRMVEAHRASGLPALSAWIGPRRPAGINIVSSEAVRRGEASPETRYRLRVPPGPSDCVGKPPAPGGTGGPWNINTHRDLARLQKTP
ncbi:MAG: NTP transferase domain-containing protein [Euryarchaeota archaeon]|nr:NTP transferase domain-containing protein [Euryarchaeota archaeon]